MPSTSVRDRIAALLRRGGRGASRTARHAANVATGAAHEARSKATPDRTPSPLDDVTLARKVETEIFRDAGVPKDSIVVNCAEGIVWLRGEAPTPEMIDALVAKAEAIPEVRMVESLLSLPGTPKPTRSDAPEGHRRDPGSDALGPRDPVVVTPVTQERRVPGAEPSPAETAADRAGRPPAPLGSEPGEGRPPGESREPGGSSKPGGGPEPER